MKFWIAARFCNAVVGVCQAASEKLSSNIYSQPRKIVTIQNGAEPAPTSSVGNSAPEKHDFTVVHVARLNWAKDQMSLLRAIAHVRLKRPHVALWIVGDGPEKSKLSAEADRLGISDLVVFAGEQRFVGDWLAKADVFVLSSVSEGLPISLIEATAAGVPSVVTDVGGMPDVIDTCGIGKVVPPRNPEVLRDAILFFADERRRSTSVRQAIRSCYQSHFTIGRMAEEYAVLYERNGRGNGRQ